MMCQPLDETEGAQPRIRLMGLFIELSGLHGRRREMCQRERETGRGGKKKIKKTKDASLIKARSDM